jgi:FlaA1/EpsC-like NDP-sugar epimerase
LSKTAKKLRGLDTGPHPLVEEPPAGSTQYGRRVLSILGHMALFAMAYLGAFFLRFDFVIPGREVEAALRFLPLVVVVKLVVFRIFGHYRGWWKYVGLSDLIDLAKATGLSSLCLGALIYSISDYLVFPRSVLVIDVFLTMAFVGAARMSPRLVRAVLRPMSARRDATRVVIVGADDTGEALLHQIQNDESLKYTVVGFLDDDPAKRGGSIHRVPVMGAPDLLPKVAEELDIAEVILAEPPQSGQGMRRMVELSRAARTRLRVVPALEDLLQGRVNVRQVREVKIEDLLRRAPRRLDRGLVAQFINGKSVLITGAGGSIGSEICRQVARFAPRRLILAERFENALFEIERELRAKYPRLEIVAAIADVCDRVRMETVFANYRPDAVFHAAAHKHVPLVEKNPGEGVKNNTFGTKVCAELAHQAGATAFVLISTDKAVRPSSVMGATKRVAELFVQGMAKRSKTKFLCVRFGNVLGSSGSVVPIFQEQIRQGGPVTVTHPEMQRFFMTIPEASQLVLQAAAMGDGGEVFVLDMGDPVKIVDLARDLIKLSGLRPDIDIPIVFTGMRPGEKLCEQLTLDEENATKTRHERIWIGRVASMDWELLEHHLTELRELADQGPEDVIEAKLEEIIPEFRREVSVRVPLADIVPLLSAPSRRAAGKTG